MDDEEPQGTLVQLSGANEDNGTDVGVHQGLGDVGLGGLTAENIGQYYDQMSGTQLSQKALIEQATAALKKQRAPSLWGSLAQGLSQVKHQPGIAGTLANINSGLSAYDRDKSAFDQAQADKEMEYKLKSLELEGKMGATGLDRIRQLAALQEAQAKAKRDEAKASAPKPPNVHLTKDANGNPIVVTVASDGTITSKPLATSGVGSPSAYDPSLVGEALMDEIRQKNPGDASQIQALMDGRMLPPTTGTRAKEGMRLLELANRVDPTFDVSTAKARFSARSAFAPGGKIANNIASFNTAISHLGELQKAADNLGNYGGLLTLANPIKNLLSEKGGKPQLRTFKTARNAVADELTRAFRGTGGNLAEVEAWKKNFDEASSPEQLQAAIIEATNLLGGRVDTLVDPYNQVFGQERTFLSWMPNKARDTFLRLNPSYSLSEDDKAYLSNPIAYAAPNATKPVPQAAPAAGAASAAAPNANALALARALAQRQKLRDAAEKANAAGVH
ncbi:MAG: hypothetical protein WCP82_02170 [Alphaproteobacteria bacterium]